MSLHKMIGRGFVVAALAAGTAAPAMATVVNTGGGTWDHGTGGGKVWSNYYHGARCHSSSVEGKYYSSSGNTGAKAWSRASAPDRWYAADNSYWKYC